ncbi:MAG TPA: hypothetical protein V6C91_09690, partial [Coleofasciculaceae cyanobacterium]
SCQNLQFQQKKLVITRVRQAYALKAADNSFKSHTVIRLPTNSTTTYGCSDRLPALIVFLSAPSVGKREILLVTPSYQEGFDTWNLKNQQ